MAGGQDRSFVRGGEPQLRIRGMVVSLQQCVPVYGKAPTSAVSGSGHTREQLN